MTHLGLSASAMCCHAGTESDAASKPPTSICPVCKLITTTDAWRIDQKGRSALNLTSLTKSTKLKIGIFICLWRKEIRGSSSGYPTSKIFTWTFESPAFKRAAVNTDWVQTSDQVICQQNTANDIKMPSVFTSQVLMDLPLCCHHQGLCCSSMRTDFL